ncbi:peptidase [Staphylococcus gallinarum]|uniref:Peptidase n=2 Tax=Staphylococcus gallinarum TaxID=1293 RepID=A0ABQ0XZG2_STAGA|nr:prophage endopeptidase tail family protein [Staphylococcus gallinarum]KIR10681.1 peptidase [Staphylococcus gallinarum]RTX82885.1 peptidase [Staphylococcus gallinarum]GEQ04574.1 peptidase [Staphylococcus gallinarum]
MDHLVLKNKEGTYVEILTEVDYGTFKYDYERNNERSLTFTIYKTNENEDIFNNVKNEMYVLYHGQVYVIKTTAIKYDGVLVSNDIAAKHIFMEFQNHYIDKDIENEESSSDTKESTVEVKATYTLQQYLDFGFEGNNFGFNYQIKGKFNQRVAIDELGNKNGMEYLTEGAELFGYIYYADNKMIYIYDEDTFYEMSEEPFIYHYNTDEVSAMISTLDLKTYIEGYGKKKTKSETKNYKPIKPKELSYSGPFDKTGTWSTESVGASYSKDFECKWGNETLVWTLKKMSKGGTLDVYLDHKKIGSYDCYSKTATSEQITIAKGLSKGKHTFKVVFTGKKSGIDYKKSKPCMYVGTEKSTVLNLTAVLKGKDVYHTYTSYRSPNADIFGVKKAPTVFDDNALDEEELLKNIKAQLTDEPTVELSTNYLGFDEIKDNHKIRFIHKPLGFNTDLKVVKISASHPYVNEPVSVEFSNASKDIVQIQNKINRNIKKVNNLVKGGSLDGASISLQKLASDSIGSVLIDE